MAKYEFTGETKQVQGSEGNPVTVKRIIALESFGQFQEVHAGDLGGWIQSENLLPQEGNSWVFPDAVLCESALIADNSIIYGNAMVRGEAILFRNAQIGEYALVDGHALISGEAQIKGNAVITGKAIVKGKTVVEGDAIIGGTAKVLGETNIRQGADIVSDSEWFTAGPIGEGNTFITFYRNRYNEISVACRNSEGIMSLNQFSNWVKRLHGLDQYAEEYEALIKLATYRLNKKIIIEGKN